MVAIDLGAESCRVSLLRWKGDSPRIEILHRIANGPVLTGGHMHWPLDRILAGLEEGLHKAAALAPEGICSIAVDGWAVDMVRLDDGASGHSAAGRGVAGKPIHPPYCYRDERNLVAKTAADAIVSPEEFFRRTGAQPMRINTVYQLVADNQAGIDPGVPWLLLPEYVLHWLGGRRVAEYTNATHTGLVDIKTGDWSPQLFTRLGLCIDAAPGIVSAGTVVGKVRDDLARLPAFQDTALIAPACHDTASAIAAISYDLTDTAYIVSGTWSLVGTVIDQPISSVEAQRAGFTNQGAAAGGLCFHTNVNGMWLLKQCLDWWELQGRAVDLPSLIAQAGEVADIPGLIDVDAAPLMLAGDMPARINAELLRTGADQIADLPGNEALFARVIFASLASRYATVLRDLEKLTGRSFKRITTLGGGSRNTLLRLLTEESTGLPVFPGEVEGSTLGNFAVQLAARHCNNPDQPLSPDDVRAWAARLAAASRS
jgi:rhamnulokinase